MSLAKTALSNPIPLAIAAGLIIGTLYFVARKGLTDTAAAAGGLVSGNNAITQGTAYEGKGVVGTVAGAIDKAAGGSLSSIGESLGGWLFDMTHPAYDPNSRKITNADVLRQGSNNTDWLWGPVGSVELRS